MIFQRDLLQATGCSEKLCSFTATPSLAYITVRDLQSLKRNASVQALLYWLVIFCTTNSSRVLAREKNTIFNEHPVPASLTRTISLRSVQQVLRGSIE